VDVTSTSTAIVTVIVTAAAVDVALFPYKKTSDSGWVADFAYVGLRRRQIVHDLSKKQMKWIGGVNDVKV